MTITELAAKLVNHFPDLVLAAGDFYGWDGPNITGTVHLMGLGCTHTLPSWWGPTANPKPRRVYSIDDTAVQAICQDCVVQLLQFHRDPRGAGWWQGAA